MQYNILKEKTVFHDFFKIIKATIQHDTFSGSSIEVDRLCFERGDGVAALIYERDTDSFLFTKQFRYPTIHEGDGWLLEIPAGTVEQSEDPANRIKIEIEEEIGYKVNDLEFVCSSFVSPGGTSERTFLYYSEVSSQDKVAQGGGLIEENEDIQLVKMTRAETEQAYKDNAFRDAKTIMTIQWFLLNKGR